ncbi:MAG: carbohydrate kinase [Bacteroidia bacterium]|nr:carbohydrate kinase [Bacteroidia bacterium]
MSKNIALYGEMLWDLLPSGKQAGGAPMNVALHLNNLGVSTHFISRVGRDLLGKELLAFIEEKGLKTDWIQEDKTYPTGVVNVNMADSQEVEYDIVQPSAWDMIEADEQAISAVRKADVLVFESLINRHETSRETLQKLLKEAKVKVKVFDTNLRPPFYSQELLDQLLAQTDLLKINHHELEEVAKWLGEEGDLKSQMIKVKDHYAINEVIATRGANGAAYMGPEYRWAEHPGFKVTVADTIGAGDSFLAAYLSKWIDNKSPQECLTFACALGAMVASSKGANPRLSREDIEAFVKNRD